MVETPVILSGTWVALMLIYLQGDVLRIVSGDMARMEAASPSSGAKWVGAAIIMLIPILMVVLSLVLPQPISRWANILIAAGFFLFILVDLRSYPSAYDRFLFVVSLILNGITIGIAWNWS